MLLGEGNTKGEEQVATFEDKAIASEEAFVVLRSIAFVHRVAIIQCASGGQGKGITRGIKRPVRLGRDRRQTRNETKGGVKVAITPVLRSPAARTREISYP